MSGKRKLQNRIRNRACCLVADDDKLLLVKQRVPTRDYPVWMPPGGEVLFGESARDGAVRETFEETGIVAEVKHLAAIHEFIEPPFHAVEFYFLAQKTGGELVTGRDPELGQHNQRILDCGFIPFEELGELSVFPHFLRDDLKEVLKSTFSEGTAFYFTG
ncbi:NUDIX domain-containing protein [Rhodohalobacter sp. SW132]|uniref:NUDIX domain-containing protein n=1 Tax=Rhodohalobacter sp. SW132 TaxID=2293433 RepID=UPI0013147689|nr:NUDIX hydrolase [Rhodohalobacter sp. SW132]